MAHAASRAVALRKAKQKESANRPEVPKEGSKFVNDNVNIRRRSTRMSRSRGAGFILQNYEQMADGKEPEDDEKTKTRELYLKLLESADHLLSMQPALIELESDEDSEADDELLSVQTEKAEQAKLGLIRQMTSNLS